MIEYVKGYYLNAPDSKIDTWQWRLVIYHGFDHEGILQEAVNRAKERGAKRAIVLSDQDFYKRLGMIKSSEVGTWVRNSK